MEPLLAWRLHARSTGIFVTMLELALPIVCGQTKTTSPNEQRRRRPMRKTGAGSGAGSICKSLHAGAEPRGPKSNHKILIQWAFCASAQICANAC